MADADGVASSRDSPAATVGLTDHMRGSAQEDGAAALEREGRALFIYMTGRPPGDYALKAYCRAHREGLIEASIDSPFQRALVRLASSGPLPAYAVDTYASTFPVESVRRKLVLVLAIDETCPPDEPALQPALLSPARFVMAATGKLVSHACVLAVCAPMLLPLHLVDELQRRRRHGK